MEQLAWSDGSKPDKSKMEDRSKYIQPASKESVSEQPVERNRMEPDIEQTPILREPSTKREDANVKISEREMFGQTCQNPFFNKRSYVEDLEIQQNFLIPQSSHEQSN